MIKVLVCRVDEDPKIEEVENPFTFAQQSVLDGGYIEAKLISVNDKTRVVCYWDEDARYKKLPVNRDIPTRALPLPPHTFSVDMREGPPEMYANPGEIGYFQIFGNFIVTKADSEGDHISLLDEEIKTLMEVLTLGPISCVNGAK